jgi:hypothetical protein
MNESNNMKEPSLDHTLNLEFFSVGSPLQAFSPLCYSTFGVIKDKFADGWRFDGQFV